MIALLTAILLLLTFFTGCGSEPNSDTPVTEKPTATGGTEEKEPDEIITEEPVVSEGGRQPVSLPLTTEDISFTWWQGFPPPMLPYMDSTNDNTMFQELENRTGIKIEWQDVPASVANEQFMILIGSGEYPDIMNNLNMMYVGGAEQALADEVIINIADYIEYAPNLKYWADQEEYGRVMVSDDGSISQFSQINEAGGLTFSGLVTPTRYLEELNMEAPTTYDELHDYLLACKNEYGNYMYLPQYGALRNNLFFTGYNIGATYGTWGGTVDVPFYVVDGEMRCGILQDEYLEYLNMMHDWYAEGIVDPNFIDNKDRDINSMDILTEKWSLFFDSGSGLENLEKSAETDFRLTPLRAPSINKTDEASKVGLVKEMVTTVVGNSITTSCQKPELCVQMFDYLYSEEGSFLANFGIENEAFEFDTNGEPAFTDLIMNNPEGLSPGWARYKYCYQGGSYVVDPRRDGLLSSEQEKNFDKIVIPSISDEYEIPNGVELNADESNKFNELYSTIDTYMSENIPQFIIGTKSFDEYESFIEQLKTLGIEECMALYQQAYDRFMSK